MICQIILVAKPDLPSSGVSTITGLVNGPSDIVSAATVILYE